MSLFKPVLVERKEKLTEENVPIIDGQYIIVVDTKELFVDKGNQRLPVSRSGIFIQAEQPTDAVEGDIWFETEEYFVFRGKKETIFNFKEGMTWAQFIESDYNIDNQFYIEELGEGEAFLASHVDGPLYCGNSTFEAKELIIPEQIYYVIV